MHTLSFLLREREREYIDTCTHMRLVFSKAFNLKSYMDKISHLISLSLSSTLPLTISLFSVVVVSISSICAKIVSSHLKRSMY